MEQNDTTMPLFTDPVISKTLTKRERKKLNFKRHKWSLLFILPAVLYVAIFSYLPMYGILIAFQEFIPGDSILSINTHWVGFANFKLLFENPNFATYFWNTFLLCFFGFVIGFPIPIIVALLLNSLKNARFKKGLQIIYYAPHFISLVVLVGMLYLFFGSSGLINNIRNAIGLDDYPFFLKEEAFRPLFIFSGNWQDFGWSSIIYLAALAGVDPSLHEASKVDGASRLRRVWDVDIPAIFPTISMILILSIGNLMSCGYEKILLMQTDGNIMTSEIISSYVYQVGLRDGSYSLASAAGLFNSVINVVLLVLANTLAKRFSKNSLW